MPPKKKPMSTRERAERQKVRTELRAKGILPPVKKPLNRKGLAREVQKDLATFGKEYADCIYLMSAARILAPTGESNLPISSEDVGVLKLVKLAYEMKRFEAGVVERGESSYNTGDLYDAVIKPILAL